MTYNYFETILSNENKKNDISSIQQIKNYVLIMILISLYISTTSKPFVIVRPDQIRESITDFR